MLVTGWRDTPVKRIGLAAGLMLAVTAALVSSIIVKGTPESRAGALGGPVIIGGDDLTDHGGIDGGGNVEAGWLYIKNALDSIEGDTTRGDGTIAALGADETGGGAADAIAEAAEELGLTVEFHDGDTAINTFFANLGGSENPSIIWISGDGASNDIGDGPGDEAAALTANANAIASFVASGGGLFSHGSEFGWLNALLPDALALDDDSSSDDLYFTAAGTAALGSLTVGDINAGPWHNYFEGDFGGLDVLVRSADVQDSFGNDAAVILGGQSVTFEDDPGGEEEEENTDCIPGYPGLECIGDEEGSDGGGGGSAQPTSAPSEPTSVPAVTATAEVPTVAVPTAPGGTTPGGGAGAGGITPPNTGSGSGSGGNGLAVMSLMAVAAIALVAGGGMTLAAWRARK